MRINIILFNVVLLILLFVLIYLLININYDKQYEKFTSEAAAFLPNTSATNTGSTGQNIVNTTYNATQFSTDSIDMELQESIPVDTLGAGAGNAFDSPVDILCQNKIVKLRGPTAGFYYPNGYYWIQTPAGPKLSFLITDDQIYGGGWLLALRAVLGAQVFNVINNAKYTFILNTGATLNSISSSLLALPIRGTASIYNASMPLHRFNTDHTEEFGISSVGNKIFNALSPPPPPGTSVLTPTMSTTFTADYSPFCCKFSIFRVWLFKEIYCKFYYIINGTHQTFQTYIKIPNRDLDNVSTLNRTLRKPDSTTTTINSFRADRNNDLIYNFKINIYNDGRTGPSPSATINCLLGCHGTNPADTTAGTLRERYIYAFGAVNELSTGLIKSSAVYIVVPDEITATNPIKYIPCGVEIFVK